MADYPDRLVVVPPTGRTARRNLRPAAGRSDLRGAMVGILDNAKPNATALLRGAADILVGAHSAAGVVERSKRISGVPATAEAIEALTMECAVVLTGSGD